MFFGVGNGTAGVQCELRRAEYGVIGPRCFHPVSSRLLVIKVWEKSEVVCGFLTTQGSVPPTPASFEGLDTAW